MLGVPEILNFYFKRIFPIQRTVLRSVRPVAQRMTDMPMPSDDVFGAVQALYEQLEGMGPLLQDPKHELDPHRAQPRAHGHQRVAAALHLPEPLRLPGRRRGRQPRAAAGGALALLRPLVRHPGRPPGGGARSRSIRCPSSRRASSTARWSALRSSTSSRKAVFGDARPHRSLLQGPAHRGEEGGRAATRCTSACPSRRRTGSGLHPGRRAGGAGG